MGLLAKNIWDILQMIIGNSSLTEKVIRNYQWIAEKGHLLFHDWVSFKICVQQGVGPTQILSRMLGSKVVSDLGL